MNANATQSPCTSRMEIQYTEQHKHNIPQRQRTKDASTQTIFYYHQVGTAPPVLLDTINQKEITVSSQSQPSHPRATNYLRNALVVGGAAVVGAPILITGLGLEATGIMGGTLAAALPYSIGSVVAGSLFAGLRNAGTVGVTFGTQAAIVGGSVAVRTLGTGIYDIGSRVWNKIQQTVPNTRRCSHHKDSEIEIHYHDNNSKRTVGTVTVPHIF